MKLNVVEQTQRERSIYEVWFMHLGMNDYHTLNSAITSFYYQVAY